MRVCTRMASTFSLNKQMLQSLNKLIHKYHLFSQRILKILDGLEVMLYTLYFLYSILNRAEIIVQPVCIINVSLTIQKSNKYASLFKTRQTAQHAHDHTQQFHITFLSFLLLLSESQFSANRVKFSCNIKCENFHLVSAVKREFNRH